MLRNALQIIAEDYRDPPRAQAVELRGETVS